MRVSVCAIYALYDIQYVERADVAMRAYPDSAADEPANLTISESMYAQYMRRTTYFMQRRLLLPRGRILTLPASARKELSTHARVRSGELTFWRGVYIVGDATHNMRGHESGSLKTLGDGQEALGRSPSCIAITRAERCGTST